MLTFNTLLRDEGIDPSIVKLVRHQDTGQNNRTVYQLWHGDKAQFDLYQRIQRELVFKDAQMIASFIATPFNETLFVGMYTVGKTKQVPKGTKDPLHRRNVGGLNLYELEPSVLLSDMRVKLVVEWGKGYRSWVQLANKRDKPIVEIKRQASEPDFPGFLEFRHRVKELGQVPVSWQNALKAVKGIYLLVDQKTGKQYVGSATGGGGFWGRWEQYLSTGHGGNVRMREVPDGDYQVSILEVAWSSAQHAEILNQESLWKEKLLTRIHGLTAN